MTRTAGPELAEHTAAAALTVVLLAVTIRVAEPVMFFWDVLVRELVFVRWNYLPLVTICVAMALVALFALVEERQHRTPTAGSRPRVLVLFVAVGLLVGAGFYLLVAAVRGASLRTPQAWVGTATAALTVGTLVVVSVGAWLISLECVARLTGRH